MVYFYNSTSEAGVEYWIVVGKDKFENDMLIKYGYKELNYYWFHADKYSSGHVYLKLQENEKDITDVPSEVIRDCLQMCKSKSIHGNKLPQCTIIATPWTNLRKSGSMKPGEVSFKSVKRIRKLMCYGRDNTVLNRLEKTKIEVLDDTESLLHEAKKSKDSHFLSRYVADNKEELSLKERQRKLEKKARKQNKNKDCEEIAEL